MRGSGIGSTYRDFADNAIGESLEGNFPWIDPAIIDPSVYCLSGTGGPNQPPCVPRHSLSFLKHRQTAIHSIHVFPGSVQLPANMSTISAETFHRAIKTAQYDALPGALSRAAEWDVYDSVTAQQLFGLSDAWTHEVRYKYSQPDGPSPGPVGNPFGLLTASSTFSTSFSAGWEGRSPKLVHRCVTRRHGAVGAVSSQRHWLYQWENPKTLSVQPSGMLETHFLTRVFGPEVVDRIVRGMKRYNKIQQGESGWHELGEGWRTADTVNVNDLLTVDRHDRLPVIGADGELVQVFIPNSTSKLGYLVQWRWASSKYARSQIIQPDESNDVVSIAKGSPDNLIEKVQDSWIRGVGTEVSRANFIQLMGGVDQAQFEEPSFSSDGYEIRHVVSLARYLVSSAVSSARAVSTGGPVSELASLVRHPVPVDEPEAEGWLLTAPDNGCSTSPTSLGTGIAQFGRGMLHYPYHLIMKPSDLWPNFGLGDPTAGNSANWLSLGDENATVWLAVVHQVDYRRRVNPAPGHSDEWELVPPAEGSATSWRVVEMNKAGIIIHDATYADDGTEITTLTPAKQMREDVVYDKLTHSRVVERRTASWTSLENQGSQQTDGLILVNGYNFQSFPGHTGLPPGTTAGADPHLRGITTSPSNATGGFDPQQLTLRLEYEGFKLGTGSDSSPLVGTFATKAFTYSDDRPDLLSREVEFAKPREILGSNPDLEPRDGDTVRWYSYGFWTAPDRGPRDQIQITTVVHSAVPKDATGALKKLVEVKQTNPSGNVIFEASGYCDASSWNDQAASIPTDYTAWKHVYAGAQGLKVRSYRCTWSEQALNPDWQTTYVYDRAGQLTSTTEGDGTSTYYLYQESAPDSTASIKRTYPKVDPVTRHVGGLVLVETIRGGQVELQIALRIDGPISLGTDGQPSGTEAGVELYRMVAKRDPFGRLSELVRQSSDNAPAASAQIGYDSFGQVDRLKDSSGTIVRTIRDNFGRVERLFRGSNDQHEVWGTLVLGDPCTAVYPDTMSLVERRAYGFGTRTAGKVISTWKYRERPANQYRLKGCSGVPQSNEESIGIVERHQFDSRLRDVWAATYSSGTATVPTRITTHFYDNLNRERVSALFRGDASITGAADPRSRDVSLDVPAASEILAAHPLQLSEKRYDNMGRVIETRTYDVTVSDGSAYTASRSAFDEANRVVWQQDSGGRVTRTAYNAKGWMASTTVLAGTKEVEKSTYNYDALGNAIEIGRLERTHDGTGDSLGATNSVQTRTFQWFDWRHQLLATAQLGTEDIANRFVTSSTLVQRLAFTSAPCTYDSGTGRLIGFSRGSLPQSAMIACYEYDIEGHQIGMVDSGGALTRTEYDGMGRVLAVTNNALAPTGSNSKQITAYQYDSSGRLSRIGALKSGDSTSTINWNATDGSIQITAVDYGAPVTTPAGVQLFTDGDLLSAIRFPDATTGQPSGTDGLKYSYLLTGEVAKRADTRNGTSLEYGYDERGNLLAIDADMRPTVSPPGGLAVDMVGHVTFAYDAADRLVSRVTTSLPTTQGGVPGSIEKGQYEYDGRGNLTRDFQQHGLDYISQSPVIDYVREFVSASATSGTANIDRLKQIVYPDRDLQNASGLRRHVQMNYGNGTPGSADDLLSRITQVQDTSRAQLLATYGYAGESRRVDFGLGVTFNTNGPPSYVTRSYARSDSFSGSAPGYDRLDNLGRVSDLNYKSTYSSNQTIYDELFKYNTAGNRVSSQITQATIGGVTHNNDRSWAFGYDALHRLISADRGHLNTAGQIDSTGSPRREAWTLDRLGGWTGNATSPGQRIINLINGQTTTTDFTHTLDSFNALKSVRKTTGSTVTNTTTARDASGNLTCDGIYVYQYDAFNRLVQVNQLGNVTVQADGTLAGAPGPWVKHYTYDGLGRLIRTQSPWPWPEANPIAAQSERYYYDGFRRIQKVLVDPIAVDDDKQPIKINKEVDFTRVNVQYNAAVNREYVWDIADTDRLLCQYSSNGTPFFVATNERWTPVAQLDAAGHVTDQFSFDPYGTLLSYDGAFYDRPKLEVGHQGLFFDRLDVPLLDSDGSENPRLAANAAGIYYNRARTYSPSLGRFLQADPNATGMAVGSMASMGQVAESVVAEISVMSLLADGAGLFERVSGNPVHSQDPRGLFGFLDIGIGSSSLVDLYQDNADRAISIGQSIRDGAGAMFRAAATMQYADLMWAMDWAASDDDYSASGVTYESDLGPYQSGVSTPAQAGVLSPSDLNIIAGAARISNHGSRKHYRAMGVLAAEGIELLLSNGTIKSISELNYERMFNRSHQALERRRPDIILQDLSGKILYFGEVGLSQTAGALRKRIEKLKSLVPGVRNGFIKIR